MTHFSDLFTRQISVKQTINVLQEWSIPLIVGVFVALLVANVAPEAYHMLVDEPFTQWDTHFVQAEPGEGDVAHGGEDGVAHTEAHPGEADEHIEAAGGHGGDHHGPWWEHYITLHFLINDIFMVFFFGIAAKEIVEAILPGGPLNPPSQAINPLLATIGGVVGPVGIFFVLNAIMGVPGFDSAAGEWGKGWGIPTATDIALAWLVARIVFGAGHPAISFLLLLAVADDAIGLGIIAFGYPDPNNPTVWANTWWIIPGMGFALLMRLLGVRNWVPYILIGGALSWWGLYSAHLHPALALVPIVPFLPAGTRDAGLFKEDADYEQQEHGGHHHSPLEQFEHQLKLPVDFGLFFFAFANAGVAFGALNNLTWIIFLSLLIGKIVGITGFGWIGIMLGAPLPVGMKVKHLFVASMVAGIGLTVALFVAGQAFPNGSTEMAAAKMGALFSGGICILAVVGGLLLGVKDGGGQEVEAAE